MWQKERYEGMKGFYISVNNGLLEARHVQSMGMSVWLFMWLLDKMTSIDEAGIGKVLGGRPVTFDEIQADLGFSRSSYVRYVDQLEKGGYVDVKRTPRGLIFRVHKATKPFSKNSPKKAKSDVSYMEHQKKSDVSDLDSDVSKTDIQYKTIQDNTSNTTNVVLGEPPFGKPEINEILAYWTTSTGLPVNARITQNRRACNNLLKRYGSGGVKKLIDGVVISQDDRYSPRIANFEELQEKLPKLLLWGRQNNKSQVEVIS